ncbi:MAG: hypothetical protein M3P43_09020 [Actinomycetota bacterium]|nr:hypothetical protein [Actinomycetota bacterium]
MSGYRWAPELLELGRRARFDEPLDEAAPTVWILVGGSDAETSGRIAAYRDALVGAFTDAEGTLISGGTGQGVSSLAADVSSAVESVR